MYLRRYQISMMVLIDVNQFRENRCLINVKQRKSKSIIFIMDVDTRYTTAAFIDNKRKETKINKIIGLWYLIKDETI